MGIKENLAEIKTSIPEAVTLVAVSKTKPNAALEEAYAAGQRDFGENKVQEVTDKAEVLPTDIRWHFIGHLQRNKVKYIAPFVHLIHAVDSPRLAAEIDKRAAQNDRIIDCLVQIHIADEHSKFGMDFNEARTFFSSDEFQEMTNIRVVGLMGMATNTDNDTQIHNEFTQLKKFYEEMKASTLDLGNCAFTTLSMGMSGDYKIAIEAGSNMVRVGSAIFGARQYNQ